jgi:CreA protein
VVACDRLDRFAAAPRGAGGNELTAPWNAADPDAADREMPCIDNARRQGAIMMRATRWLALAAMMGVAMARAETIGDVDTAFQWLGPDHKIVVEAYDDPKVNGVACYVSRAKTGGIKGALGIAEDKAEASIACRQIGPISFPQPLPREEDVFSQRLSILFKRLHIVRMVDPKRNALVYLTYSDKLVDGSPKNSVTAVPVGRETPIPVKR